MLLIFLEALLALALFLLLIWWTMFAGRKKGELHAHQSPEGDAESPDSKHP